jgi:hypothetical protein
MGLFMNVYMKRGLCSNGIRRRLDNTYIYDRVLMGSGGFASFFFFFFLFFFSDAGMG